MPKSMGYDPGRYSGKIKNFVICISQLKQNDTCAPLSPGEFIV